MSSLKICFRFYFQLDSFEFLNVEAGPLCPSLLPAVPRYFSPYFDIGLLGVKQRLPSSIAFDLLMEKRNQLLTVESAPTYFSYFNK